MRSPAVAAVLLAAAAFAQTAPTELLPTARQSPTTWHYTTVRPAARWNLPTFDDQTWKTGRSGFGSPGTPAIVATTPWTTPDIWLRRQIQLPATLPDPATLQFLVFHDEDAEIYLDGTVAARLPGFGRDYEPVDLLPDARRLLKANATLTLAVHCHQTDGGQGIDVGLASLTPDQLAARRKSRTRVYALSHPGDPAAGQRLFSADPRLACAKCHSVDGSASRAGPDLFAVGDKFTRPDLIDAVLNPSAAIAVGYETTVVTTKSNDTYVGVLKSAADEALGLMTADGKLQHILAADVQSRRTTRQSLMPDGQEIPLSNNEFADLIAYLTSLRLPAFAGAARAGMPSDIPTLATQISLIPLNRPEDRFNHPCWLGQLPGDPSTFLICEHETGKVWRLSTNASGAKTLWGDFRSEIRPGGAIGLLGIAFHPDFLHNHRYFIQHQLNVDGRIHARVSEKIASSDFTRDSGQPSRTILDFTDSTDVHAGGGILFGPDGFLYVGMGDTGPQGDPEGHAQDLTKPLGKMLRIDVDHQDPGLPYAIPADNPFRNRPGASAEIFAYGFREPWRFSFDPATGDLWVGDVGQDRIEEVDLVRPGENFGWNVYEGFDLFSTRRRSESAAYTPPVFAYDRRFGSSVTGGYVYRSPNSPFDGLYVCGDFTSKRVWALQQSDRKLTHIWQLCTAPEPIASFARDDAGTLYLVGYDGSLFRLDFTHASPPNP